jgi:hypothetical protein
MTFTAEEFVLENLVSKYRTKFRGNEIVCEIESCRSECREELAVLLANNVARNLNVGMSLGGETGEL